MLLLNLIILAILLLIFAQDLKSRSVHWIAFLILTALFIAARLLQHTKFVVIGTNALISTGFLIVQLLLVTAYFSLKYKRWINITVQLLGWGDIMFINSITFYLSISNFLFFYIGSLLLALFTWLCWQAVSDNSNRHIPLAGLQAFMFALFLTGDWWLFHLDVTNDHWLLNFLIK